MERKCVLQLCLVIRQTFGFHICTKILSIKLFVTSWFSRSPICHCIYPLLGILYLKLLLLTEELKFMYILTLFIFFKNYFVWWLKCIFLYILTEKGSQRVLYYIKIITKSFFLHETGVSIFCTYIDLYRRIWWSKHA